MWGALQHPTTVGGPKLHHIICFRIYRAVISRGSAAASMPCRTYNTAGAGFCIGAFSGWAPSLLRTAASRLLERRQAPGE